MFVRAKRRNNMRRDIFVVYMTSLVLGSGMIGCSTNDVIVNEHEHGNVHEHEHGNVHEHEHDISQTKVHISEMVKHGDLNISDVWARPGFSGGNTAVYMSLVNVGEEAEYLVGAESDICRAVEIHQISMKGDVMTMLPVSEDIALLPDQMVQFIPGDLHFMMIDLDEDLTPKNDFQIELRFKKSVPVVVNVMVSEP